LEVILTKIVFTVFHNCASDILRGSKQLWTLASKISRGNGPSNPRRIDAYDLHKQLFDVKSTNFTVGSTAIKAEFPTKASVSTQKF